MSIRIMEVVWQKAPYAGASLLTLLALADWADDDGVCWPKIGQIAKRSRQSLRNASYVLRKLSLDGMLIELQPSSRGVGSKRKIALQYLQSLPDCTAIDDTIALQTGEREERKKESNKERKREEKSEPSLEPSSVVFEACSLFADSELPEGVTRELWREYAKMRKCIRSPLTEYAEKQEVKNLWKLCHEGYNPVDVINQSITKSWRGLFPISRNGNGHGRGKTSEVDWEDTYRYGARLQHMTVEEYKKSLGVDDEEKRK